MPVVHDSIRTNSNLDVYPTHEAKLGKGGYRTVANIAERDNITYERCEEGMLVTVLEDDTNNNKTTTYILKQNTRDSRTWEKFNNGAVDADLTNRVTALETSSAKVDNEIATLNGEISTKVSLNQHNNLVASLSTYALKSDLNTLATKDELNDKLDVSTYTADKDTFATKDELNNKADLSSLDDLATKTELNNKADRSELDTKANSSDLQNLATKEKVNEINSTLTNAINTKANQATTYTKTEVDNLVNAKANANATVNLTGDQSIAGAKTFSSPVVVPDATETIHAVNLAQLNTKANWNAIVNLTDDQTIAGAKTFTSNITAPNITAMQNNLNTIFSSTTSPVRCQNGTKEITVGTGGNFQTIQEAIQEARKYSSDVLIKLVSNIRINKSINLMRLDLKHVSIDFNNFKIINSTNSVLSFLLNNCLLSDIKGLNLENVRLYLINNSSLLIWGRININCENINSHCVLVRVSSSLGLDEVSCNIKHSANLISLSACEGSSISIRKGATINDSSASGKVLEVTSGSIIYATGVTINTSITKANQAANTITTNGIIFGNYSL